MSRPPKSEAEKRTCYAPAVRMTKQEYSALLASAEASGLSLSEYRRQLYANGYAVARAPIADTGLIVTLNKNAYELNAIGKNVHQIIRALHIHNDIDLVRFDNMNEQIKPRLLRLDNVLDELEK